MRTIPTETIARFRRESATVCRCFLIERRDGVVLGFTDHDRAVTVMGIACEPQRGLDSSDVATQLAQGPGSVDIAGILDSDQLNERDLASGLYNFARLHVFLADWREPAHHVLVFSGEFSDVVRQGARFRVVALGPAHRLNRQRGRLFHVTCDAELGDQRCRIDLESAPFATRFVVTDVGDRRNFRATSRDIHAELWFSDGRVRWSAGRNTRLTAGIEWSGRENGQLAVALYDNPVYPIQPGDGGTAHTGCDKTAHTCHKKFDNIINFQGFPHIPTDLVLLRAGSTPGSTR